MSSEREELISIIGNIPNDIFDYLSLSDEIREEWRHGGKASDFGYHNQFVRSYTSKIVKLINKYVETQKIDARIDELKKLPMNYKSCYDDNNNLRKHYSEVYDYVHDKRLTELRSIQLQGNE